jgi:sugar phosphate isomerase/epimerase
MRLSCLPVSFFADIIEGRMTLAEWARLGRRLALDAVDLSILFLPERTHACAREARRQVDGEGMRVAMLTTYPDFTHPDASQRRRELALEQRAVELAAEMRAELVRVTAGQAHPGVSRADGIAWAADGLTRLLETTRDTGVTLAYENHAKPGAWTYTDFSQPPDIFLEIVRATADVGLRINFDTGNAAAFAPDPVTLLEQVIDRVVSVHAADTQGVGIQKAVLLGTGVAPFEAIFERLRAAGWDGWVCLEEASFMGEQGVEAAARFVRQTWERAGQRVKTRAAGG